MTRPIPPRKIAAPARLRERPSAARPRRAVPEAVVWRRESQIGSVEPQARIVRKAAEEVPLGLEQPDLRELSLPAGLLVNEIGVPAVAPIRRILTKAAKELRRAPDKLIGRPSLMKLAFIVLAHQRPAQLALLLSSLQHPAARTYLHIDRRARIAPFESEFARHGIAEVELLPRHDSRWGGIGAVDAALEGLGRGLRERCDYFVLLSGQDFPLRPIAETAEFFAERRKRSYVGYFSLPDSWRIRTEFYSYSVFGRPETVFPRGEEPALSLKGKALNGLLRLWTTRKPPRRFPSYLRPFGGSSWWNLSAEAARFALRFVDDHPDYRAYHRYTLAPDEIFFHSILLGTSFGEAHPIVNDPLRFTIWPPHSSHPKTLRSDDLPAMLESGKPFGRKFDLRLDRSVIENLPA